MKRPAPIFHVSVLSLLFFLCALAPLRAQCPGGQCVPPSWSAPRLQSPAVPMAPAASAAQAAHQAVVRVEVKYGRMSSKGSGTLIGKNETRGLVLTCWHLFRDGQNGQVIVSFPDGSRYAANVLGTDQAWDLALVEIASPAADAVRLASEAPQPGEPIRFAGYGQGSYRAVSGQVVTYRRTGQTSTAETLECTGAARSGDSGGPVLNARGELVGVLWGTDGATIEATYCGRVRGFLGRLGERAKQARPDNPIVNLPRRPINSPSTNSPKPPPAEPPTAMPSAPAPPASPPAEIVPPRPAEPPPQIAEKPRLSPWWILFGPALTCVVFGTAAAGFAGSAGKHVWRAGVRS